MTQALIAHRQDHASGVWSTSTPVAFEEYIIFCVGQDVLRVQQFKHWAATHDIGIKPLIGKYEGKTEISFMTNRRNTSALHVNGWLDDEESVLLLSKCRRNGQRNAEIVFFDGRPTVNMGLMGEFSADEAAKYTAWSYDPSTDKFWIAWNTPKLETKN